MEAATATREDAEAKAAEAEDPEADPDAVQLSIEGDGDLSLTVGGSKPDEAVLSFGGGEIKLGAGQFQKGQRVAIVLVGPVVEVAARDVLDPKTRQLSKTRRKHLMKPDLVKRVALETVESPR